MRLSFGFMKAQTNKTTIFPQKPTMSQPKLLHRTILASLGLTLVLWTLALLFKLHLVGFFQEFLIKKLPGPTVTLGSMIVLPLIAMVGGTMLLRRGRQRLFGVFSLIAGGILVLSFVGIIGRPMAKKWWGNPRNPQTPLPMEPQVGLPVFPGAEGFGTRTPAGRGGKVIEVTTLADDGPGSLRAAVSDPAPRIIVFRVAGIIELQDFLTITHPFVTIAGQTAPGGGICLKDAGIVVTTHDVLIQHLRIRPGMEGRNRPEDNDAITIFGKYTPGSDAHHVVVDHVSMSWSEDEVASVWFGAHDITFSNCLVSEALNQAGHEKGTHSAGLLVGDGSNHVSIHHCLLAHNGFRNPLFSLGGTHDFVNNVVYDWGTLPAEIYDLHANSFLNFIGNDFLPGPSSVTDRFEILVNPTKEAGSHQPKIFVSGNRSPHRSDPAADEWSLVGFGWHDQNLAPESMRSESRFETPPITATKVDHAFEDVLAQAGASLPRRDAVDKRVVVEVKNKTGRIIDSPDEVGGYPKLAAGSPSADSDHDGMPDDWEQQSKLNPGDPVDAAEDRDGDGYTNIEEYLHSLQHRQ